MQGQLNAVELRAALSAALGPYAVTGDGNALDTSLDVMATLISLGWIPPPEVRNVWLDRLSQDAVRSGAPAATHGPPSHPPSTHWSRVYRPLSTDPDADPAETAARARERANRLRALLAAADHLARAASPEPWTTSGHAHPARDSSSGQDAQVQQLQHALSSRPPIEHAVGMLMLALSCSPERAWRALVALSQVTNRPVRETAMSMAEQVAAGTLKPAHLAAAVDDLAVPSDLGGSGADGGEANHGAEAGSDGQAD